MNVFDDPLALSEEDWKRCFAVDLEGAWNGARAADAGAGRGQHRQHRLRARPQNHSRLLPYPVAKHALIGMTRLGLEYAARGIRVNSISPGLIVTDMIERHFAACPIRKPSAPARPPCCPANASASRKKWRPPPCSWPATKPLHQRHRHPDRRRPLPVVPRVIFPSATPKALFALRRAFCSSAKCLP
jgi:NAD(P)-dependent dehydrogenase (short-subunit alcohol dehydrogenase family)